MFQKLTQHIMQSGVLLLLKWHETN